MASNKLSSSQMAEYYRQTHRQCLEIDREDILGPVIHPGETRWVNRFVDFAHRLGMKRAFACLEAKLGSLAGRTVLDLGCGRGRWTREYAFRGCRVTGVDVSSDAIKILAREMPEHRFLCQDLASLNVPSEAFDIVNSVTVLQHMPEDVQRRVMKRAMEALKQSGYFVLMENTVAFESTHVFPHRLEVWLSMAEDTGFQCCSFWGSNYEVLFRAVAGIGQLLTRKKSELESPITPAAGPHRPSLKRRAQRGIKMSVALASYPLEWFLFKAQLTKPSHRVMIFQKCVRPE